MTSSKESADPEQQSYFYVVWPEESKSPGGGITSCTASAAPISTSSCSTNASTLAGVTGSPSVVATTVASLAALQSALNYEVVESRHNSSSSSSIQSRSPESPMHMQGVCMASVQNKVPLHGSADESPKVNSNGCVPGIRPVYHTALPRSSAGGLATTATYVIPSIAGTSGRHNKSLYAPADFAPPQARMQEPDGEANLRDIGEVFLYVEMIQVATKLITEIVPCVLTCICIRYPCETGYCESAEDSCCIWNRTGTF